MKIAFLGDIAFVGKFDLLQNSHVYENLKEIAEFLNTFDYVVANLESPITDIPVAASYKAIHLKASSLSVDLLNYLNIKIVNLSNNHIFDYGVVGYEDTINLLNKNKIEYFGIDDKELLLDFENNKIAFNGYCCYSANGIRYKEESKSPYITPINIESVENRLKANEKNGYLSVLSFHWGIENVNYPAYEHIQFARSLAEKHKFILYGHHPHVAQGVEKINDSIISYSLGNFVFDEVLSTSIKGLKNKMDDNNRTSFILSLEINENKIEDVSLIHIFEEDGRISIKGNPLFETYCETLYLSKDEYQNLRKEKLGEYLLNNNIKHDFSWFIKRLNRNFIEAYLRGRRNASIYNKMFNKYK